MFKEHMIVALLVVDQVLGALRRLELRMYSHATHLHTMEGSIPALQSKEAQEVSSLSQHIQLIILPHLHTARGCVVLTMSQELISQLVFQQSDQQERVLSMLTLALFLELVHISLLVEMMYLYLLTPTHSQFNSSTTASHR